MGVRLSAILSLAIGLLTAGETLLFHWLALVVRGEGLVMHEAVTSFVLVGAINLGIFPSARRRLHARGAALFFSRTWILGSIAALMTGVALAILLIIIRSGGWLLDAREFEPAAFAWLGGMTILLGFGSVLWGSVVGNHRVRVDRLRLDAGSQASEHDGLQIAHITDLHIGPLLRPERLREFVDRINALEPDLIAITGDIFDFDAAFVDDGCGELARLEARHGVFAVLGNHDVYTGAELIADGIDAHTDIRLLRDEWEQVSIAGAPLAVAGIEDPGKGWANRDVRSDALERLAREIPRGLPCVLLAHRPSYFAHAAELGFPLVLAGHTHGGQVAPPVVHHHNPSRLISRWTRGVFQDGESTLYVNRGLGMAGLPLRLNCPREIALIQLASSRLGPL